MTVRELKALLESHNDDEQVYLSSGTYACSIDPDSTGNWYLRTYWGPDQKNALVLIGNDQVGAVWDGPEEEDSDDVWKEPNSYYRKG